MLLQGERKSLARGSGAGHRGRWRVHDLPRSTQPQFDKRLPLWYKPPQYLARFPLDGAVAGGEPLCVRASSLLLSVEFSTVGRGPPVVTCLSIGTCEQDTASIGNDVVHCRAGWPGTVRNVSHADGQPVRLGGSPPFRRGLQPALHGTGVTVGCRFGWPRTLLAKTYAHHERRVCHEPISAQL
jgi:hypothetical protein